MEIIEKSPLMQELLAKKSEEVRKENFLNFLWKLLTFRFKISREYFDHHFQALESKYLELLIETAFKAQTFTEFEKEVETTLSSKAKKDS